MAPWIFLILIFFFFFSGCYESLCNVKLSVPDSTQLGSAAKSVIRLDTLLYNVMNMQGVVDL